eukprot:107806-Pelagomonas_calceolata.AAC.2
MTPDTLFVYRGLGGEGGSLGTRWWKPGGEEYGLLGAWPTNVGHAPCLILINSRVVQCDGLR